MRIAQYSLYTIRIFPHKTALAVFAHPELLILLFDCVEQSPALAPQERKRNDSSQRKGYGARDTAPKQERTS